MSNSSHISVNVWSVSSRKNYRIILSLFFKYIYIYKYKIILLQYHKYIFSLHMNGKTYCYMRTCWYAFIISLEYYFLFRIMKYCSQERLRDHVYIYICGSDDPGSHHKV